MKNAKIFINNSIIDSEEAFGVFFTDASITALMTPSPLKGYVTNKSSLLPGKQVVPLTPKVDERDIQLTFGLQAPSLAKFLMQYYKFCKELEKGKNGNVLTSLDMILDGVRMDIKSITKNKAHYGSAIRAKNNQLIKFNARTDTHEYADTLCMYFDDPTMFAPGKIRNGYEYMKLKTSRDIQIKHIVCVINSAKGMEIKTFDFK